MVGKDDNMKSRKSIAMMLAVMLTAASAAGPAFAAENSAQTAGTEQTSGAVFEDGTRDESQEKTRFTFTSSNTRAATADAAGTVTGKSAGTVTTTAKAAETADYETASKTVRITANKALKKPGNCHFIKWNSSKYTSCRIGWNKTEGAEGYETLLSWTDGSHANRTIVKSNVRCRDCTVHPQHVSQMMVRAFYMSGGQRKFGPWSNVEYITPSPTRLTAKNASSGTNLKMNISWNIIYGCNGYNVFLTTNPNGTWYWNQSTAVKATATSAVITRFRGSAIRKNTRYYVRIVTRRQRNGVFCTVPMPASNTYIGSFIISGKSESANVVNRDPKGEYIGNRNSKIFHHSWCASVRKMSDSNKVRFESRNDAIKGGYRPCKNCNP